MTIKQNDIVYVRVWCNGTRRSKRTGTFDAKYRWIRARVVGIATAGNTFGYVVKFMRRANWWDNYPGHLMDSFFTPGSVRRPQ